MQDARTWNPSLLKCSHSRPVEVGSLADRDELERAAGLKKGSHVHVTGGWNIASGRLRMARNARHGNWTSGNSTRSHRGRKQLRQVIRTAK